MAAVYCHLSRWQAGAAGAILVILSTAAEFAMRHLYSAALYVLSPLIMLRLLLRSLREPTYRSRLAERWGVSLPPAEEGTLWVHAVSVGEVHAAAPLVEGLLRNHPRRPLLVTTGTPAGSARVRALFGGRVRHCYLPLDLPGPMRRLLRRFRPALVILVETELWPNLLHQCRRSGCRVLLASARLSQRSARGYGRFAALTREMFCCLDAIACQSQADSERFLKLGAPADIISVCGSLKFEQAAPDPGQVRDLRVQLGCPGRPVLLAASTHPGEDEAVLGALHLLREAGSDCLLLLAPRHPARCDRVARLCAAAGWRLRRLSGGKIPDEKVDILLVDTLGELPSLSTVATLAFIGGSLVPAGGQNTLEAAAAGVPIVTGPYTENFARINTMLEQAGALQRISRAGQLGPVLRELLADDERRAAMGAAGRQVAAGGRGARDALLGLAGALLQVPAGGEPYLAPEEEPEPDADAVGGGGGTM
jgi:3-deoxy-D-manno-octulosonic-acid transferase